MFERADRRREADVDHEHEQRLLEALRRNPGLQRAMDVVAQLVGVAAGRECNHASSSTQ